MAIRLMVKELVDKITNNACGPEDLAYAYGLLRNPNLTDEERRALDAALKRARLFASA